MHQFITDCAVLCCKARVTVCCDTFISSEPKAITRLVKPPLDFSRSRTLNLPKHDSKISVLPGRRSPRRAFRDSSRVEPLFGQSS